LLQVCFDLIYRENFIGKEKRVLQVASTRKEGHPKVKTAAM